MKRRRSPGAHAHSWWTDECALAAQMVQDASDDTHSDVLHALHHVTTSAKRTWADQMVTMASVWDIAKWHHGRKSSAIAALRDKDGSLVYNTDRVAALLAAQFFVDNPSNVRIHQHDDPPPRTPCQFHPFTADELERYLKETSNTSAPGFSGQTWGILKLAWSTAKDHFTALANACVWVSHHPSSWKTVLVVIIPKPGCDDYTATKNYCPISLLECFSKLLEKAVLKHFLYDINAHCLIPTTQFGTHAFSCTLDAGLTLLHNVHVAHRSGLHCTALMFDIKGFFDNVHKDRLAAILMNLGFPPSLC